VLNYCGNIVKQHWKKFLREYEKQRCEEDEKLYTAKEIRQFYQNNSI
jgi:hypothetical protein